ncbi:MAG: segregation/condensation protein A [Candidatus Pacebacteria bacterium]|nr:segregation/condensation protein A [Candidatus Paceibacterota bacterium]
MSYIVKAHHYKNKEQLFEGPLDLLLDLIEKEKLDITDIALAQVAGQFIAFLESSKEDITPGYLSSFILVAGKLILIKSKAILPMLELEKEEEEDIEELKARLREYQKFKEISKEIKRLAGRKEMFFSKQSYSGIKTVFCPPEKITVQDLKSAFESVLDKLPEIKILPKRNMQEIVSIKDRIDHIQNSLLKRIEITFRDLTIESRDRVEIVVTFLAMLELVRKNIIVIEQIEMFGDINIKKFEN